MGMKYTMSLMRAMVLGTALFAAAGTAILPSVTAAATGVAVVVNGAPITSGDIARRAAFLKLQRSKSSTEIAREQLIDEALKRSEIARLRMSVSNQDVDASYARFAASNKLSTDQLNQILDKAGVSAEHFKQYIAIQMSWPRVVNARYAGAKNGKSLVDRMQENGGQKPSTTEYFLQQVIFVVPAARRNAILGKRKAEAEASRSKYPGCDDAKIFAATMHDVSIRNLGRLLAPQLPDDWKPLIEKAEGNTTGVRVTDRGVEYLGICKKREVNDDIAAEMVFRAEDLGKGGQKDDSNSQKYVDELRKKARIEMR
ncbi:peptidylprolyl isomerase [Rhizobium sp. ARZ01]|uniref:peptidylprolyl isomerase n=1 Tax=Rhizobium sp. ARZ01 TaxID=2769313 RepID=UPI0017827947|nr:peptidylprolyl isomerase [Rhizobium sp. ARZ01]MBD9371702.1 peptidylprolyl isomerase [Rhizobium sp. ARZ01]